LEDSLGRNVFHYAAAKDQVEVLQILHEAVRGMADPLDRTEANTHTTDVMHVMYDEIVMKKDDEGCTPVGFALYPHKQISRHRFIATLGAWCVFGREGSSSYALDQLPIEDPRPSGLKQTWTHFNLAFEIIMEYIRHSQFEENLPLRALSGSKSLKLLCQIAIDLKKKQNSDVQRAKVYRRAIAEAESLIVQTLSFAGSDEQEGEALRDFIFSRDGERLAQAAKHQSNSDQWRHSSLVEMLIAANVKQAIASPAVQTAVYKEWYGSKHSAGANSPANSKWFITLAALHVRMVAKVLTLPFQLYIDCKAHYGSAPRTLVLLPGAETPVVRFALHAESQLFFLLLLLRTAIVQSQIEPHWSEWLLVVWICCLLLEEVLELRHFFDRAQSASWAGFKAYFDFWNTLDAIGLILMSIVFVFRFTATSGNSHLDHADTLFAIGIVIWVIRLVRSCHFNYSCPPPGIHPLIAHFHQPFPFCKGKRSHNDKGLPATSNNVCIYSTVNSTQGSTGASVDNLTLGIFTLCSLHSSVLDVIDGPNSRLGNSGHPSVDDPKDALGLFPLHDFRDCGDPRIWIGDHKSSVLL
jgi:hypothetical protein